MEACFNVALREHPVTVHSPASRPRGSLVTHRALLHDSFNDAS